MLIARRCALLAVWLTSISLLAPAQEGGGRKQFEAHCVTCHGGDGNGGEFGPSILARLPQHTDDNLMALITNGLPARGMPPSTLGRDQLVELVNYLRMLRAGPAPTRTKVRLLDDRILEG